MADAVLPADVSLSVLPSELDQTVDSIPVTCDAIFAAGDAPPAAGNFAGGACNLPCNIASTALITQFQSEASKLSRLTDHPANVASQANTLLALIDEHTTELDSSQLLKILYTIREALSKAGSSCSGTDKYAILATRVMLEQKISILQKQFVIGRLRALIVSDVKDLYQTSRNLFDAEAADSADLSLIKKLDDEKRTFHNLALQRLDAYKNNLRLVPELLECKPTLEIMRRSHNMQLNNSSQDNNTSFQPLFTKIADFADILREKESEMKIFHKRWLNYADEAMVAESADDFEELEAKIAINSNVDQDQEHDSDDDYEDDDEASGAEDNWELEDFCPNFESLTNPKYGAVFDSKIICEWINQAMLKFREGGEVRTVDRIHKQMSQLAKRHKWKLTSGQLKDLAHDVAEDYASLRGEQRQLEHQQVWHKISKAFGDEHAVADPRKMYTGEQEDADEEDDSDDEDAVDADDADGFRPPGPLLSSNLDAASNKMETDLETIDADPHSSVENENEDAAAPAASTEGSKSNIPAAVAFPDIPVVVRESSVATSDGNTDVEMNDVLDDSVREETPMPVPLVAAAAVTSTNETQADGDLWTCSTVE